MLILHLGMSNPLAESSALLHADAQGSGGNAKVFRAMRSKWGDVVPVLMKWVWDADAVQEASGEGAQEKGRQLGEKGMMMPAEGWEERVGTSATAVLYEVCRVQRLNADELCECAAIAAPEAARTSQLTHFTRSLRLRQLHPIPMASPSLANVRYLAIAHPDSPLHLRLHLAPLLSC